MKFSESGIGSFDDKDRAALVAGLELHITKLLVIKHSQYGAVTHIDTTETVAGKKKGTSEQREFFYYTTSAVIADQSRQYVEKHGNEDGTLNEPLDTAVVEKPSRSNPKFSYLSFS